MKAATPKYKLHVIFILAAVLLLSACNSVGNHYLGSWENSKNTAERLEITRNGDNFLVTVNQPARHPITVPAILRSGNLEIKGDLLSSQITYVQSTDTLIMPGMLSGNVEYRRRK